MVSWLSTNSSCVKLLSPLKSPALSVVSNFLFKNRTVIAFKCVVVIFAHSFMPETLFKISVTTCEVRSHTLTLGGVGSVITVTERVCETEAIPSLAITVTVALPVTPDVIVTVVPTTLTVATVVLLDVAE